MSTEMRSVKTLAFASVLLAVSLLGSGCASMYVDGALKDVSPTQVQKPQRPQDAQLLFNFQTKGTANARATDFLRSEVLATTSSSGLFATVGPDPALSGAILNITINNIVMDDAAVSKGLATGLTLGLVGNVVTDGYVCTIDYLPPGGGNKLTSTSRHAIHTTVGAKGAPPNAIKAKNGEEAARTMTRQIVTAALQELSQSPDFH